ncbi:WYL domain-containing protein [Saccharibacillus alkalitolerans]|uniref:WYL domain-containing protein n=1 Tax=Saccharibacillus alkalitolerans TaxID=2705290 RepID=A0ABX0F553_9BACL|nr:WYL domain-containing protein [Saccharibacillus alkalitolerans]NGZ75045.1 WYL domain-containing protein [Saccharibacillus alkalitolerans]
MMHPFEKIFSYQLSSRLEDTGVYTLTSQERSWLKLMLEHPAAAEALEPRTIEKLRECTLDDGMPDLTGGLEQKAGSREVQTVHPLLGELRSVLRRRQGMRLQCRTKKGKLNDPQPGIPCKLEYSMVKREWYLHWYNSATRSLMHTRLCHIVSAEEVRMARSRYEELSAQAQKRIAEGPRYEATVEVIRVFNAELTRILHAFSCFDKRVEFDEEERTYRIHLTFNGSEGEYVLTKLRFLGKRVKVVEGEYLKNRMRMTARKALALYGAEAEAETGADAAGAGYAAAAGPDVEARTEAPSSADTRPAEPEGSGGLASGA